MTDTDHDPKPPSPGPPDETGPGETGPGETGPGETGPGETGPGDDLRCIAPDTGASTDRAPNTRPTWLRALLLGAGAASLVLAILGIFLPLLPTTPLILLAAFFFARGSQRAHNWLLRHRVFGEIVRQWEEHRCIPPKAKWTAIALVLIAFTLSFLFVPNCVYGYATLVVVGVGLIIFLAWLPTTPRSANAPRP